MLDRYIFELTIQSRDLYAKNSAKRESFFYLMNLQELNLKFRYRSNRDDFVADFFNPCLRVAVLYQRAVGYFSSGAMFSLSRGIVNLLKNDGQMQLVASPYFSEADIKAIEEGYDLRKQSEDALTAVVDDIQWSPGIEALSWLIAENRLDVKIACCLPEGAFNALYHEKLGVITDSKGDYVAFAGSANETYSALEQNLEVLDVDFSWNDVRGVAAERAADFEDLWTGRTNGIEIYAFPDAARKGLLQKRRYDSVHDFLDKHDNNLASTIAVGEGGEEWITLGGSIPNLYTHQKKALDAWLDNESHGIFEMCTGAGKTITALSCIVELAKSQRSNGCHLGTVVVACPTQVLVEQWLETLRSLLPETRVLAAYDSCANYAQHLRSFLQNANNDLRVVVTTYTTCLGKGFIYHAQKSAKHGARALFIADEVHNISSSAQRKAMDKCKEYYAYRLGLSATPRIEGNPTATRYVFDFFGGVVSSFNLSDAIEAEILCPYYYFPRPVFMDPELSLAFSKLLECLDSQESEGKVDVDLYRKKRELLRQRGPYVFELANLVDANKTGDFSRFSIVFCPPGRDEEDDRILHKVKSVFSDRHMLCGSITASTSMSERPRILDAFAKGELQVLLAIGCLDEGMDIPATRNAVMLYSVDRSKQFIQRRGRVLRRSEGKKHACIHDLIMLPHGTDLPTERKEQLLHKELRRYREFAGMALNAEEAESTLDKALEQAMG